MTIAMKIYENIEDLLLDFGLRPKVSNPLIHVLKIEDEFPNQPMDFDPFKCHFFEFTFSEGHDIEVKTGLTAFNPKEGAVNVTSPFQLSSWQFRQYQEGSEGFMVYFKPALFRQFADKQAFFNQYPFYQLHTSPLILLNPEQKMELAGLLRLFLKAFHANPHNDLLMASYLTIVLEQMKVFYQAQELKQVFANRAEEISYGFERLLSEEVAYTKRLTYYADRLNISSAYMAEAVKSTTGKSPQSLVQEYLVIKAKESLVQRDDTIQTIAEELGFDEVTNFVKYFKKIAGQTPAQFRKAQS